MQTIGHIDHERVEYIPARIEVAVDRREKVACTACHQDIATASRPGDCKEVRQPQSTAAAHDAPQPRAVPLCDRGDAETVLPSAGAKASKGTGERSTATPAPKAATAPNEAIAPGAHVYRRAGASLLAHLLGVWLVGDDDFHQMFQEVRGHDADPRAPIWWHNWGQFG